MQHRTFRALAAAAAGSVAVLGLAAGPALASSSPSRAAAATAPTAQATVPASISGDDTTAIGHMTFHASNTSNGSDAATGFFSVQGTMLPVTVPGLGPINSAANYSLAGPVTCLHVQGDEAGFIYPVTSATGTVMQYLQGKALYITVKATSAGQPAEVGFAPVPGNLPSCPPLVPFLNAQSGSITVTPAH